MNPMHGVFARVVAERAKTWSKQRLSHGFSQPSHSSDQPCVHSTTVRPRHRFPSLSSEPAM